MTHDAPTGQQKPHSALANIYRLGIKELWSLVRDPMMLILIVYLHGVDLRCRHGDAGQLAQGRHCHRR